MDTMMLQSHGKQSWLSVLYHFDVFFLDPGVLALRTTGRDVIDRPMGRHGQENSRHRERNSNYTK